MNNFVLIYIFLIVHAMTGIVTTFKIEDITTRLEKIEKSMVIKNGK